jgi:hypothetical protein
MGLALCVAALIVPGRRAQSEDTLPTGAEVVKRVNERDDGQSLYRKLSIELIDKSGKSRKQQAATFRKYYGDEKKSVIIYTEPANIRDTGFMTFDYAEADKEDDQWLYLPAARKVRRISSANRGDYYLGTDFTYEDIKLDTRLSAEDYEWKTTSVETQDGHACFVIEGTPVDEKTKKELGYGKYKAYIDREIYISRRADLWDINGNPLKTVEFRNIEQVQDIWTVAIVTIENHKTGHKTLFTFADIDYENEVNDRIFTEQSLSRGAPAD